MAIIQTTSIMQAPYADGLSAEESNLMAKLVEIFNDKDHNNKLQLDYYRDNVSVKNLGVAVPKKFERINAHPGWAAKVVDVVAERTIFDGYTLLAGADEDLNEIVMRNDFYRLYSMAVPSELIFGCGFWTVTKGEPYPEIRYFNARSAAALWDYNKRRIKAGFVITNYEYNNQQLDVEQIVLHTENSLITMDYGRGGWVARRENHMMGRPMMEAMCYKPTDEHPFGKSRISKAIMGIYDEMQREVLRMSVNAEFYSAPQRYALGIDPDAEFQKPKEWMAWETFLTLGKDSEGDTPKIGQFSQASMTPHLDVMRNLASRLAAEASIPVDMLGIIHDNPSSAEALRASQDSLTMQVESLNRENGLALRNVARMALAVYKSEPMESLGIDDLNICVNFKNPNTPSIASQTDAMVKQASIVDWLSETSIFWEMLGYNDEQRMRIQSEKREAQARLRAEQAMLDIRTAQIIDQERSNGTAKSDQGTA